MNWLRFKTSGNYSSFERNLENMPQFYKEKPKDVKMQLVSFDNTRVLTCYAPKIA
jgi:hypothetical protein